MNKVAKCQCGDFSLGLVSAGATALGKLHMVNLAASELAEREGDRSLCALGNCLQVCPRVSLVHAYQLRLALFLLTKTVMRLHFCVQPVSAGAQVCCTALVQALQAGRAQVPYEESCLTRLLADSMGHDRSRAVLIATCRCACQPLKHPGLTSAAGEPPIPCI